MCREFLCEVDGAQARGWRLYISYILCNSGLFLLTMRDFLHWFGLVHGALKDFSRGRVIFLEGVVLHAKKSGSRHHS